MREILIQNAQLVNEGELSQKIFGYVGKRLPKSATALNPPEARMIDATGLHLLLDGSTTKAF